MKIFGKASEFYRVRVQEMSEETEPEMGWDESILYREPPPFKGSTETYYAVQAIAIDNNQAFEIKRFSEKKKASRFKIKIAEDLADLTKNQFEEKFIKHFD